MFLKKKIKYKYRVKECTFLIIIIIIIAIINQYSYITYKEVKLYTIPYLYRIQAIYYTPQTKPYTNTLVKEIVFYTQTS